MKYDEIKMIHGRDTTDELFFSQIVKRKIHPDDKLVAFPRLNLEKDEDIDNTIFEETDMLYNNNIYPGSI